MAQALVAPLEDVAREILPPELNSHFQRRRMFSPAMINIFHWSRLHRELLCEAWRVSGSLLQPYQISVFAHIQHIQTLFDLDRFALKDDCRPR